MSVKRKLVIAALSVMLVLTIVVGGTLAYLTRQTETRINSFTFADSSALGASLTEPAWDGVIGYVYDDNDLPKYLIFDYIEEDGVDVPVYGYVNGDKTKPITDKVLANPTGAGYTQAQIDAGINKRATTTNGTTPIKYGIDDAQDMIPGQTAAKDPRINNTSTSDFWAAMKVTLVYTENQYEDDGSGNLEIVAHAGDPLNTSDLDTALRALKIIYNDTDWEFMAASSTDVSRVFLYKSLLTAGASTIPLFTQITCNENANNSIMAYLQYIGGVTIYIEGAVMQSSVGDYDAFKAAYGGTGGITFADTPYTLEGTSAFGTWILPQENE